MNDVRYTSHWYTPEQLTQPLSPVSFTLNPQRGALVRDTQFGGLGALQLGKPKLKLRILTVDELLRTCPTPEEQFRIRQDFNISFDASVPESAVTAAHCTYGGSESNIMLSVYNAFRLMRLINFDRPLPLIGATNLYQWLRDLQLVYRVKEVEHNCAGYNRMYLRWQALAAPRMRYWADPVEGCGIRDLIALILHEARHTNPGGAKRHTCDVSRPRGGGIHDINLGYGGAWGLQFWYYVWLGRYSGPYLTAQQKHDALVNAEGLRLRVICNL